MLQRSLNEADSDKINDPPSWAAVQQNHPADGASSNAGAISAPVVTTEIAKNCTELTFVDETRTEDSISEECRAEVILADEHRIEVPIADEHCAQALVAEEHCAEVHLADESEVPIADKPHLEVSVAVQHSAETSVAAASQPGVDQSQLHAASNEQFPMTAASASSHPRTSRPNDRWNASVYDHNYQWVAARRGPVKNKKTSVFARVFGSKRPNGDARRGGGDDDTRLLHRWHSTPVDYGVRQQNPSDNYVPSAHGGAISRCNEDVANNHYSLQNNDGIVNNNDNNNNGFAKPGNSAATNADKKMPDTFAESTKRSHHQYERQNSNGKERPPNYAGHIAAKYFRKLDLADDFHVSCINVIFVAPPVTYDQCVLASNLLVRRHEGSGLFGWLIESSAITIMDFQQI
jgi:hypothetical protein